MTEMTNDKTNVSGAQILLLAAVALLLSACAPAPTGQPAASATPSPLPATAQPTASATPEPEMTDLPTDAPSGEVPAELMAAIKADLAGRLEVTVERIAVVEAEAVQWSDSSLGCPQPGQMYLQVITPGYQVVLQAEGRQYDYRAAAQPQHFFLCEGSG